MITGTVAAGVNDHSQVHELRDIRDPLICLDAQHAGALVADRVDGPAERTAHQAPQHGPTDAALSFRRADHGYATGSENGVQGVPLTPQHIVRPVMTRHRFAYFGGGVENAHN